MTDQVLDILKLVLLALLYLFFARVLWAVWSEVREPANVRQGEQPAMSPAPAGTPAGGVATPSGRRTPNPPKGRRGVPARLVVIEPKDRKGTAYAIDGEVTIGREPDNTLVVDNDTYISSYHARVAVEDGVVVVDDLSSRNGTFLNGTRITKQRAVNTGDRIQVGYTVLEAQ